MEARKLLFELSHPVRFEIIHLISEKPQRLTKIAELVKANKPEVSRHLDRLREIGVIEKKVDGSFRLAQIGHLILNCLPSFEFLAENSDYFRNHDLLLIPPHFISRLGDLREGELKHGAFSNIDFAKGVIERTKERLRIMTEENIPEIEEVIVEKIAHGVDYRIVVNPELCISVINEHISSDFEELAEKTLRFIKKLPAVCVVTENEAIIVFLDHHDKMDYSVGFYSKSESFKRWCWDFVEYFWNEGKRINKVLE